MYLLMMSHKLQFFLCFSLTWTSNPKIKDRNWLHWRKNNNIITVSFKPTICRQRNVEQMADKRGFVRRNRGLFNSNTGPSHTNKKLQEIYFEAARHRRAMQKMWKRIGDNPTHYCSMWATDTYRVCKETWWASQNYPSEIGKSSRIDGRQKSIL